MTKEGKKERIFPLDRASADRLAFCRKGVYSDDGIYKYFYDFKNRLVKVTLSSDTAKVIAEYKYDYTNRRLSKNVDTNQDGTPDKKTEFVYNGWQVAEEVEGGSVARSFTYGAYIDEPITMSTPTATYYYTRNQQYSVTAILDDSGDIVEGYTYSPYGKMTVYTGTGTDSVWFTEDDATSRKSAVGQPYGYTGRRYDAESGLWYFRNRMYSDLMGKFLQRDPLGEWIESEMTCLAISNKTQEYASDQFSKYTDGMNIYANSFVVNKRDAFGLATGPTIDTSFLEDCCGEKKYNITYQCCEDKKIKDLYKICIRSNDKHSWVYVQNLNTLSEHTYGRFLAGFGGTQNSGVAVDVELRLPSYQSYSELCDFECNYDPTINSGYNLVTNNCTTYASDEWERTTGTRPSDGLIDNPTSLKKWIDSQNQKNK